MIKVTQRSTTAGNITISCNTTLCGFFWVINSMEAYFLPLEVNMRFKGYVSCHSGKQDCIRSRTTRNYDT